MKKTHIYYVSRFALTFKQLGISITNERSGISNGNQHSHHLAQMCFFFLRKQLCVSRARRRKANSEHEKHAKERPFTKQTTDWLTSKDKHHRWYGGRAVIRPRYTRNNFLRLASSHTRLYTRRASEHRERRRDAEPILRERIPYIHTYSTTTGSGGLVFSAGFGKDHRGAASGLMLYHREAGVGFSSASTGHLSRVRPWGERRWEESETAIERTQRS